MAKKRVISDDLKKRIAALYKKHPSMQTIATIYSMGVQRVKTILKEQGVRVQTADEVRKRPWRQKTQF